MKACHLCRKEGRGLQPAHVSVDFRDLCFTCCKLEGYNPSEGVVIEQPKIETPLLAGDVVRDGVRKAKMLRAEKARPKVIVRDLSHGPRQLVCAQCGKPFETLHNTRKLCSHACQVNWKRAQANKSRSVTERKCGYANCGRNFIAANDRQLYCCHSHAVMEGNRRARQYVSFTRTCRLDGCDATFTTSNPQKLYCCRKHTNLATARRNYPHKNYPAIRCEGCDTLIEKPFRHNQHVCSKRCSDKVRNRKRSEARRAHKVALDERIRKLQALRQLTGNPETIGDLRSIAAKAQQLHA